jgi:CRISPR-associated endonuclease/helicase Cas3
MCPVHRRQVIGEIEARLSSGQPCRVVSTQLLEAGVDLDFPLGYRALAGLESIAQAAGRVNRNKRVETALLYVFESDSDSARRAPKYIRQSGEVARMVLERFPDPMSIEAIRAYYHELNQLQSGDAFDYKNILNYLKSDLGTPAFAFKTAADNFHLIEETTQPVIIPWDEKAVTLLEKLLDTPYPNSLARALQPYTVNIYQHELEALQNKLAVEVYLERFNVLSQTSLFLYHDDTGLEIPANEQAQAIYVD